MRHRVLMTGAPGSGKSQTIVDIALANPESQVVAFDRQDGIRPLLARYGEPVPNLELVLIDKDGQEGWSQLMAALNKARSAPADAWIAFDVAEWVWALAKESYVEARYGQNMSDFLLGIALASDTKKKKPLQFGGLSPDDWTIVKSRYYLSIPKTLGVTCQANVLVTAELKDVASYEKDGERVFLEKHLPAQYREAGIKPQGESSLTGQVDTVLQLEHPTQKRWKVRTLGKGRYGEMDWVDFSNRSWWDVYTAWLQKEGIVS